jgi:MAF protein
VLASASPRRQALLSLIDIPFDIVATHVDERVVDGESPASVAVRLASAKAIAVAGDCAGTIVLGCDTLVALEGEVLGKPADRQEARLMLDRLRGRSHKVLSGVALVGNGQAVSKLAETVVNMRDYDAAEMDAYVSSGNPLDKAGAYAIQHSHFHPVLSWDGCYANVMGLPLCSVVRALRDWDLSPVADVPAACQAYIGEQCDVFRAVLAG